jgi:glucokinase
MRFDLLDIENRTWDLGSRQMNAWVVGIDLGATKIRLGLVSPQDQIVAVEQIPTQTHEGPASVVERICGAIRRVSVALPAGEPIGAVGICSPGPVDLEAGMLVDPPNMQGLHHTPLRSLLSDALGVPVVLEHDAKAAALGDYYFGAGRGSRDMVFVVVGTGVGAAVIFDGEILRGTHNSAGEIGHTTLDRNGELCSCGSRGCVETYMSGPRLAKHYRDRAVNRGLADEEVSGSDVMQRAQSGDPIAREVFDEAGSALGAAIATMAMMLDVDLYVIGGSVAKAGDLLLEPARRAVPLYSFKSVGERVRILPTALHDDGPVLGSAWLARRAAVRQAAAQDGSS